MLDDCGSCCSVFGRRYIREADYTAKWLVYKQLLVSSTGPQTFTCHYE